MNFIEYGFYNLLLIMVIIFLLRVKHVYTVAVFTTLALVLIIPLAEITLTENINFKDELSINTTQKTIFPDLIEVDVGIYVSGNLSSLRQINGSYYEASEVLDDPGIVITSKFLNVQDVPDKIRSRVNYNGNHQLYFQIYNHCKGKNGFLSSPWDQRRDIGTGWEWYNMTMGGGNCYLDDSNTLIVQIYHNGIGSIPHDVLIDYLALDVFVINGGKNLRTDLVFWIYPALISLILINLGLKSGLLKRAKQKNPQIQVKL